MEYGYEPRTAPFAHQKLAFAKSARKRFFALFMDPGTGKSKVIVDTAAYLFQHNKITGLLIYAPNDVDDQWITQEIPRHMPSSIKCRAVCWDANSVKARRLSLELATHPLPQRLAVLAINHEALTTKRGREVVERFLKTYITLFCIDEAHGIKTPTAARSRWACRLGVKAYARRILTGTPITKTPFDLFGEFKFLDDRIIGFDSFLAFKHEYAAWTTEYVRRVDKRTKRSVLQPYETLQGYKNLDKLYARIDPFIFRQNKEDCLDLPPKMLSVVTVQLSPAQRALYDAVKEGGITLLQRAKRGEPITPLDVAQFAAGDEDEGRAERELLERIQNPEGRLTAQIKLVTLLRCRQIVGGYVTTDEREIKCIDGDASKNPRMRAALTWLEAASQGRGKLMVWARFTPELRALHALITEAGYECCLINGDSKAAQRKRDIAAFKDRSSSLRVMATHEQSMGVGMDFNMVSDMLFYSCSYSYYQRSQAEDRAHRIGQTGTVTITDLFARDVAIDRTMANARAQAEGFKTSFMHWGAEQLEEAL